MDGLINFTGSLAGNIDEGGGSGVTPHVTATASVNDQTGVPGVTVVRSGTDEAPNFDFNFVNLKGADGVPGAQGPQGLTGPTGPAGAQGPRGFTGATGATGPAGADGYSPAVSVTDIPGGHRVTITDETHPLGISFDVMNGIDGQDGQDGSPGPQGPRGQAGAGVPEGGTVGQILTKASAVDYDTEWLDNEAAAVDYDNTASGLAADNVQAAVDEINSSLTQISTLTITRTENSYYNATSISRLSAYKKNGMLFINGNLGNSTAIPALADFIEIGRISGWGAVDSIMTNIPSQGDGTKILNVLITGTGIIRIFTGTGIPVNAWTRFGLTVPSNP